jgi:uncharacterized protein DUF3179
VNDPIPLARRRSRWALLALWLFGASAAVLSVVQPSFLSSVASGSADSVPAPPFERPFDAPGIRLPAARPRADVAALADEEPVIGVCAGGRTRAYLVRALAMGPKFHIVNDALGGVPITVTYCNLFHCTRLFTATGTSEPLDISQGGLKPSGMVLKVGGYPYRQDSSAPLEEGAPSFPYDPYPGDETTWGTWRQSHPDTDLYVGDAPLGYPPADESAPPDKPHPSVQISATDRILGFVASAVYPVAAPVLIGLATLLVHALLRLLLSPRHRPDASHVEAGPA